MFGRYEDLFTQVKSYSLWALASGNMIFLFMGTNLHISLTIMQEMYICVIHLHVEHPTDRLKLSHSVDGTWTKWGSWRKDGQCSKSCGYGTQKYYKTRSCIGPKYGGRPCRGGRIRYKNQSCLTRHCPGNLYLRKICNKK
jgi:hypothetical protein